MTTVTAEEIAKFRSELADNSEALEALDVLEECKGNLEDATEVLALQAGTETFRGDRGENDDNDDEDLLQKLANKLRLTKPLSFLLCVAMSIIICPFF